MAQLRENAPLLNLSSSPGNNPQFRNGSFETKHQPASSYGVIDVTSGHSDIQLEAKERSRKLFGGVSVPLVAVIVGVVSLVLIISFTVNTGGSANTQNVLQATESPLSGLRDRFGGGSSKDHVDIEIPQGRLRGYTRVSRQGREYKAFYKVPYAEPPLGTRRFKDPVAPSPWKGLRDIPMVAPQCIQKEKYSPIVEVTGDEDCLYGNVYTPRLPKRRDSDNDLLPTMVYIHGGGFFNGNGSRYGPDYFMDEDVVVITFQFRMGAFGFLSTGDDVIHGNMGLKDQVQMLKWVKDNIKYFNGDPNKVTIYGNSGGGMCVGSLLLSPMATGLFHRAISQSPACFNAMQPPNVNDMGVKATMEEVGRVVGCDTSDSQKYWECLVEKDANDIALVLGEKVLYGMVIEDRVGDETTKFMPDKYFNILESGKINSVPYMVGSTNAEMFYAAAIILGDENMTNFVNDRFEESKAAVGIDADLNAEDVIKVKDFYFGNRRISNSTFWELGNAGSDSFVHCGYTVARYHAQWTDTYIYWLTKPPYKSYIEKNIPGFPARELGVVHHADELQYLFLYANDEYPEITKDDKEYFEFSKYLVKLWVNFARTGDGTMDGMEWPKLNGIGNGDPTASTWLELTDAPKLITDPGPRMQFWDQFDYNKMLYKW